MSVSVGSAYLEIIPSAKGFVGKLQSEVGGGMAKSGAAAGESYSKGMRSRVSGMAKSVVAPLVAVTAAVGVKDFLSGAIAEARESQKVGALTTQVIKSTGGAAKVTAAQVGDLSTAISNKTGIDDEAIQSGANMVLTFKNIRNEAGKGNDVFNQTTQIVTDMSSAMGTDMKSSAILVGKALNDPVKGLSALSRVGVTFTEGQKKQIKSLVASGKTMGAQKIILKELKSEFGGAAAAQATAGDKAETAWNNFKEAVGTAILPILDKLFGSLSRVLVWMTTKLPGAINSAKSALTPLGKFLAGVFASALPKVKAFFQGTLLPALRQFGGFVQTTVLPALRDFGKYLLTTIVPAAIQLGKAFIANVLPVIRQFIGFITTSMLPTLKTIAGIIINTVVPAVAKFVQKFVADALPVIQKVGNFIAKVLVPNLLSIYRAIYANVVPIVKELANQIATNVLPPLSQLWHTISTKVIPVLLRIAAVIAPIVAWFARLVAKILGTVIPILLRLIGPILGGLIKVVAKVIGAFFGFIGKLITWGAAIVSFGKTAWNAIVGAKDKIVNAWKTVQAKFTSVLNWVKGAFSSAWSGVQSVIMKPINAAKSLLSTAWSNIRHNFTAAKDWVLGGFAKSWNGVKSMLEKPIKAIRGFLDDEIRGWKRLFSGAVTGIGKVWGGIKAVITSPINGVIGIINAFARGIENLVNKIPGVNIHLGRMGSVGGSKAAVGHGGGHVPGRAAGGVIPGPWRGPTADNVLGLSAAGMPVARVNPGEFITNVAATRAMRSRFPGALEYINSTGRLPGFAGGGWLGGALSSVGDVIGGAWNGVKGFASILANPVKWLKDKILDSTIGKLGSSLPATMAKGMLRSAVSKIGDIIKGSSAAGGIGGGGPGKPGAGWQWQWDLIHRMFPSAVLTSAYRPGAVTAGYGTTSYHALGRAIDVGGPPALLLRIANWIKANYGSKSHDLIYSGGWGYNSIFNGHPARINDVTYRNHLTHVHWGFNKGGLIPYAPPIFDRGGTLAPGLNMVDNRTGRPESLVRADAGPRVHVENLELNLPGVTNVDEFARDLPLKLLQTFGVS